MLSTADLVSGLFGFWSMGAAIWLFIPEFVDVWRHPMADLDVARFVFFASWLVGDAAMLAGLLIVGEYILTQLALYAIVLTLEVALLLLMMWTVGDLCCSARVKRPFDNPTRHIKAMIHGEPHMPPGDDTLDKRRTERARARGEPTQEVRDRRRKITQIVGTIVVLVLASLIWLPVDFLQRESKEPPPESSLPDPTSERYLAEQIGYILAWIGFPCWTVPRLYCMYDSWRRKAREGITIATILIGGLAHGANIASVMIINNKGEALQAQLPYILTSVFCIVFDVMRLGLKYVLRNAKRIPPEHDHSILWAYERYLSDYNPTDFAAADAAVKNQSIRLRTRRAKRSADRSDSDEHLTPAQMVDARLRAADNHHARSLSASPSALMNVPAWSGDAQERIEDGDSPKEARRKLDEQKDAQVIAGANARWAKFRQQQIPLRNLQHELDEVKEKATRLEEEHEEARRRHDTRRQHELEAELHALHEREVDLQRQLDVSPYRPHTLDPRAGVREEADDGLDEAARHRLETEHKAYTKYARKRDDKLARLRQARWQHSRPGVERGSGDDAESGRRTSEDSSAAEQEHGLLPGAETENEQSHLEEDEYRSAQEQSKRSRWRDAVGRSSRSRK